MIFVYANILKEEKRINEGSEGGEVETGLKPKNGMFK